MPERSYYAPEGGHPPQTEILTDRAVFTNSYAVIPKGCMRDIVVSFLPFWDDTRFWVIARPLSGFAESFSQYIAEVAPGGGSDKPETDSGVEAALFVMAGVVTVTIDEKEHELTKGGFVYIPPSKSWKIRNTGDNTASFHWFRKAYVAVEGLEAPDVIVANDNDIPPMDLPDSDGLWATTRFMDPGDMRHDMHITVVTFQPGGVLPFAETHVMEHGLYVLEGKGVYRLNQDWVEVEAGDFMWLRAFCPQACYAGGPGPFRYLLYKDVNRHMPL